MLLQAVQVLGHSSGQGGDQREITDTTTSQIDCGKIAFKNRQAGIFKDMVANGAHAVFNVVIAFLIALAKLCVETVWTYVVAKDIGIVY